MPKIDENAPYWQVMRQTERTLISEALNTCGGDITRTAAALGITRNTLRYRIRSLGLTLPSTVKNRTPGDPVPSAEPKLDGWLAQVGRATEDA